MAKRREKSSLRNRTMTYIHLEQYPSMQGLISLIIGAVSWAFWIGLYVISYLQKGKSGLWIGFLGILCLLCAITGSVFAIIGLRDPDAKKGRSLLGIVINSILFLISFMSYILGLM
ncbi:MAG: hypothetical protein II073_02620 [Lachnospiraceae bacterium]|nr:hypothetical protein [Lachnospiraceae bacterium]